MFIKKGSKNLKLKFSEKKYNSKTRQEYNCISQNNSERLKSWPTWLN